MMGDPGDLGQSAVHLLEPPRIRGGRDRGRESSLLAFAILRELGLVEPGPVVLLGDAASRAAARAYGVAWDDEITPRGGRLAFTSWAIRLRIAGAGAVRCWSLDALRVVAALGGRASVRAALVEAPRSERDRRTIARVNRRLERIDLFDEQDACGWERAGVPSGRLHVHDASGGVRVPQVVGAAGELLPRRPGERVLTTLADHPALVDARRLSFLLAILSVGEYRTIGLCPDRAGHMEAGRRYHRMLGERFALHVSARPTIELLRAADMCVWPSPTDRAPARGARNLLRALADRLGVAVIDPPDYADPSGPTPPEMVRPALRHFAASPAATPPWRPASPPMAGSEP